MGPLLKRRLVNVELPRADTFLQHMRGRRWTADDGGCNAPWAGGDQDAQDFQPSVPFLKSVRQIRRSADQAVDLVLQRLNALHPLAPDDVALIRSLGRTLETHVHGAELVREGASINTPRFLVSGWACRYRLLEDGRRQIVMFVLPGDGMALCFRPQPLALCSAIALSNVQTLNASHLIEAVRADSRKHAELERALHIAQSLDEAALIDQVLRVGRLTAYERVAHLLLELHHRLLVVGLADTDHFLMPLTQEVIADATGLSVVHVNRTLQQLRRDQLLDVKGGEVGLPKLDALTAIAAFRPPQPSVWRELQAP